MMKGNAPFALGGFFDEAPGMNRLCLLTTEANEVLHAVHDHMPVIVRRADWEQWLEPGELDEQLFRRITTPYAAEEMEGREVSTLVNNVKNDGPECGRRPEPTLL
jgi:putative SOS response-associated peptidase YedK